MNESVGVVGLWVRDILGIIDDRRRRMRPCSENKKRALLKVRPDLDVIRLVHETSRAIARNATLPHSMTCAFHPDHNWTKNPRGRTEPSFRLYRKQPVDTVLALHFSSRPCSERLQNGKQAAGRNDSAVEDGLSPRCRATWMEMSRVSRSQNLSLSEWCGEIAGMRRR